MFFLHSHESCTYLTLVNNMLERVNYSTYLYKTVMSKTLLNDVPATLFSVDQSKAKLVMMYDF